MGTGTNDKEEQLKTRWRKPRPLTVIVLIGLIVTAALLLPSVMFQDDAMRASAANYGFGSENVITGSTVDTANKDVADGVYEQLIEGDAYSDTNFSGSSENVVTGTGGGGTFSSALDDDDTTRRSYTEADTGEAPPDPYSVYLFPNGDSSVGWDAVYPTSPTTHYDKCDETAVDGDGSTTYVETDTGSDEDRFNMEDLSDPGAGYALDVTVFAVHQKDAQQGANFQAGIRISTTNYIAISESPTNGVWVNTSGTTWTVNPSTSSEWTYAEVNDLLSVITTDDASPTVFCTQIGLKVDVTFSGGSTNYELEAQITYSSVTSSSQTTGYKVFCQGYRSGSEDFGVFAWDYVGETWNLKDTIDQASDYDFDFALTADERDGAANEVKLRILGGTETEDTTQDIVYFDVLKVSRLEMGYALEVEMTASSVNEYGDEQLSIKGYTTTEPFDVDIWNVTSADWDLAKITVSALTNTPYSYELLTDHHRSGTQQVKIRFVDTVSEESDTTQDTLYLDLAEITWVHTDPVITLYGDDGPVNVGEEVHFWLNYSDEDDEVPEYVRVVIAATPYAMSKNETDTSYWDGVNYSYSTSALTGGEHSYYFAIKDANSGEVTTSSSTVTINRVPVLSQDGVDPPSGQGSNGDTFSFYVIFTDDDGDLPDYIQVVVDSTPYAMTENSSGDVDTTDGKAFFHEKVMAGGPHTYYFQAADYLSDQVTTSSQNLQVNNGPTLADYQRLPGDPVYPTTEVTFTVTFTDVDGDLPTAIKWRESEGAIQNLTMSEVDADADTTDGKDYEISLYLSHGSHDYDFWATDGLVNVDGGDNSITISNRAPTIDNTPGTTTTYRSTYWSWDVDATDLDSDDIAFAEWDNCTFALSIDADTGLLEGTTDTNLGWYEIWVYANDSYGGSDSYNFQLTVANRIPVIDSSGNTTQGVNTYLSYLVQAHDDDSDELGIEFATNCSDAALDGWYVNGTMTTPGWYWMKVWVNDTFGGSDLEAWDLTVSNEAPYFTSTPIYSAQNASFYSYDANASDPDPDTELEYTLLSDCEDLTVHLTMGYVNGTLSLVGSFYVNCTVSDGQLISWQNFSLECLNTAPTVTSTPVTDGELGVPYYYDCDATDINDDELLFEKFEGPSWLFIDSETGELEGTPTTSGDLSVKIRIHDGYDYAWDNFTLSIPAGEEPEEPEAPTPAAPLPPGPPPIYDDEPLLEADKTLPMLFIAAVFALLSILVLFVVTQRRKKKPKQRNKK